MRRKLLNNEGFALVLVLLMMTIFMILGLSFFSQSLNTAKQVSDTESRIQAVDLAEMGAQYYKTAFMNNLVQTITREVDLNNSEIDLDICSSIHWHENDEMLVDYTNSAKFQLVDVEPDISDLECENGIFIIKFIVNGEVDHDKNAEVEMNLEFNLNKMIVEEEVEHGDSGTEIPRNEFPYYFDPDPNDNFNLCNIISDYDFTNKNCRYDQTTDIPNNEKITIHNTKLKVDGNFEIKNQLNSNKFGNLNHSIIYVTGDFTAKNLNNLANARIYVGGSAYLGNMNSANVENNKFCINVLKEVGGVNDGTVIFAKTYEPDWGNKEIYNSNVIIGPEAFSSGGACYKDISTPTEKNWNNNPDDMITNETYEY